MPKGVLRQGSSSSLYIHSSRSIGYRSFGLCAGIATCSAGQCYAGGQHIIGTGWGMPLQAEVHQAFPTTSSLHAAAFSAKGHGC